MLPLILTSAVFFSATAPKPEVREMQQWQGSWYLLSTADAKHTDPGSPDSRMSIGAGGSVAFMAKESVTGRGKITLDCSGKLRGVVLKLDDGRTFHGVYELKGNELTVCFSEAGQPRPDGVVPKRAQWAETWKRESL